MKKLKEFMTAFKKVAGAANTRWVEWMHIEMGKSHCKTCLKLDKCWFSDDNKPKAPQHFFCHCVTRPIDYNVVINMATAKSDYTKFNPYLFNVGNRYPHNKQELFRSWGYTTEDSLWLQKTIEEQGLEKYVNGEYTLGLLNKYGQRIDIRVEIPRKDREGIVSFITGWMVYPNGHIQLNTPYGGK